jgi:hypothetical protein
LIFKFDAATALNLAERVFINLRRNFFGSRFLNLMPVSKFEFGIYRQI